MTFFRKTALNVMLAVITKYLFQQRTISHCSHARLLARAVTAVCTQSATSLFDLSNFTSV